MQKDVKPTGLTSLKGLKVSPFNESENQKGVKVKPLIDLNHFVEKNKGIKVNPLHNDKSCIEDKISPNTESDYMENYNPASKYQSGRHRQLVDTNRHTSASAITRQADAGY